MPAEKNRAMTIKQLTDRSDIFRAAAIIGGRALLGLGLGIVLSMVGLAIAWGLFIFSGAGAKSTFMIMSMVGGGIGAGIGANIAWIRLDRQQRLTIILTLLLCVAGGVIGGMIGYQFGANREIECCAEPSTTPFTYTAFGATIGANVVMYLATASIAAVHMSRARGGTIPGRP